MSKIIQFPNYNIFFNVNVAYSNFLTKILNTKINVLLIKNITIKDYVQDLFVREPTGTKKVEIFN